MTKSLQTWTPETRLFYASKWLHVEKDCKMKAKMGPFFGRMTTCVRGSESFLVWTLMAIIPCTLLSFLVDPGFCSWKQLPFPSGSSLCRPCPHHRPGPCFQRQSLSPPPLPNPSDLHRLGGEKWVTPASDISAEVRT